MAATAMVTAAMVGVGAYSSYDSAKRQNDATEASAEQARRKYLMENSIATEQIEEQDQIAMEKMTEVSRAFLKAKGSATAIQAESGVTGNVAKRFKADMRKGESESKQNLIRETQTNKENIARGMLANKIDLNTTIANLNAQRVNTTLSTITGGIQMGATGYSLAKK